jgi:hypothetical protein
MFGCRRTSTAPFETAASRAQVKLTHEISGKLSIQAPGVKVETWSGYVDILRTRHNITAAGKPW